MKSEGKKSRFTLVILIILIIIGTVFITKYSKKMIEESNVQDLRTNMLLMQAEMKKGLEEVCFRIVNLDEKKTEDLNKINEIKKEYLKGIILTDSPEEVQEAIKSVPEVTFDENCYYLDENILTEIGIKKIDKEEFGYFIVKYNFSNADVEVINTKGYDGNYTLTQIMKSIEEE